MDEVLATRRALAAKYGAKYGISTELICAVVEQESNWNPWATRPEEGFYYRYVVPLGLTWGVSIQRSISYGLLQLMGQVAREFGFTGEFLTELCNPDVGLDYGCKKLKKCLDDAGGDETKALLRWNGGGAPGYAAQVLARKEKYAAP